MRTWTWDRLGCLGFGALLALGCSDDGGSAQPTTTATASQSETGTASTTNTTGDGDGDPATTTSGDGDGDDTTTSGDGDGDASTSGDGDGDATSTAGTKFDVGEVPDAGESGGPAGPSCEVVDDMDAVGECEETAPPDAFEPEVQWEFNGLDGETQSMISPLVVNLNDDNDDGEVNLCDIPDVVVGMFANYGQWTGHLYALDGETGDLLWQSAALVDTTVTPAIGDLDGDGDPEIIAASPGPAHNLVLFDGDGSVIWTSNQNWNTIYGSFALADVDNDGTPEIIGGVKLWDVDGSLEATMPTPDPNYSATTAADLDDDGDLEIIVGHRAYHHDGTELWSTNLGDGYPQVADLDDDGLPEILLANTQGLSLIEHDGTVTYQDLRPTGDPASGNTWRRPATIHDFDGDGAPEYAVSSRNNYAVYEADATILWQAAVLDSSGIAAGTAFDFDGDSIAEAMYADETTLYVFDGMGESLLEVPRSSGTIVEYPVVADIDNDGSAEILVVSNAAGQQSAPGIQAIRDVEDRWIQARRIWNQHTYHVTNVREDGTIPQFEQPHWESLNTFRTNAQIEGGGLCQPPPQG